MAIEVLNYPLSPCGEKVRFALAEKGLPFKDHHINLDRRKISAPTSFGSTRKA